MVCVKVDVLAWAVDLSSILFCLFLGKWRTIQAITFKPGLLGQGEDIAGGELIPHVPGLRRAEVGFLVQMARFAPGQGARHGIVAKPVVRTSKRDVGGGLMCCAAVLEAGRFRAITCVLALMQAATAGVGPRKRVDGTVVVDQRCALERGSGFVDCVDADCSVDWQYVCIHFEHTGLADSTWLADMTSKNNAIPDPRQSPQDPGKAFTSLPVSRPRAPLGVLGPASCMTCARQGLESHSPGNSMQAVQYTFGCRVSNKPLWISVSHLYFSHDQSSK